MPAAAPDELVGPADSRKGRAWRTGVGGGAITWGLLLSIAASTFVVAHLTLVVRYGYGHLHGAVQAMFWVSLTMLASAVVELGAGAACLRGAPFPRLAPLVAAMVQVAWAVAAITGMATNLAPKDGPALLFEILAGLSVLPSIAFGILALIAGKWMTEGAPGRRPTPVPYQTWAAPLVIVLAALTFARLFLPVAIVTVGALGRDRLRYVADDYFYAVQPFWGAVIACLLCVVLIVSGISLARGRRWSLFAGGAVGLVGLLVVIAVPVLLLIQRDTYYIGGEAHLPMLAWTCFVHGTAAWVALAGAIGTRFRLAPTT